ncbi:hypothetical protein FRC14_000134 [Serendipita sp. 396]|nr:hypothetical protein FRC14_000134 [Serendipita sp. 396]KAG8789122.1 hypothetical protein FRC15_011690 [Serendipita sp. 397]KAG8804186.1 hypothetical protein FRC16_000126 [Serendipita sp. 398]KAG8877285.1 hypothetical protein FRC20_011651 [Serendipita sp. 405]
MSTSGAQIKATNPNVIISSPPANKASIIAKDDAAIENDAGQPTLASIPLEELNSKTSTSKDDEVEDDLSSKQKSIDRKGKGRAKPVEASVDELENYDLGEDMIERDDDTLEYPYVHPVENASDVYPPVGDDELEERRVTENLKRWEEAEKQRRRAARESTRTSFNSQRSSIVGDVGRRASKLWKDGAQRRSSLRKGATRLRDDVSFEDTSSRRMSGSTTHGHSGANGNAIFPTPSRSTTLSLQDVRPTSPSSPTPLVSNNPFATPRGGSPNSQVDESGPYGSSNKSKDTGTALMEESSNPPTPAATASTREPEFGDRAILRASTSYTADSPSPTSARDSPSGRLMGKMPPPQPLDLPKGVSPPPRQPERTPSPILVPRTQADVEDDDELEARETTHGRWWTDWLCGCREGGRQGQDQSGRTNPFE